jgi:putative zinc finger/helix-turn-helix YgiT family protein
MICLKCENEEFVLNSTAGVEQEFRGETVWVKTPVMVCKNCGWQTLAEGQLDELGRRTADAYRKKHGLLTSAQIKAMRESLDMTQRQFAEFLRVGEASVKRWETWFVQDASSDELIRVKCISAKRFGLLNRLRKEFVQHLTQAMKPADWIALAQESESLLAGLRRYFAPKNTLAEISVGDELLKSLRGAVPFPRTLRFSMLGGETGVKLEWLAPSIEIKPKACQNRFPERTMLALQQASRAESVTIKRLADETETDKPHTEPQLENDSDLALAA